MNWLRNKLLLPRDPGRMKLLLTASSWRMTWVEYMNLRGACDSHDFPQLLLVVSPYDSVTFCKAATWKNTEPQWLTDESSGCNHRSRAVQHVSAPCCWGSQRWATTCSCWRAQGAQWKGMETGRNGNGQLNPVHAVCWCLSRDEKKVLRNTVQCYMLFSPDMSWLFSTFQY